MRETGVATSVFIHSGRFLAARRILRLLVLWMDSEAKYNSYRGVNPTKGIYMSFGSCGLEVRAS